LGKLLLAIASTVILGFWFHGAQNHTILPHQFLENSTTFLCKQSHSGNYSQDLAYLWLSLWAGKLMKKLKADSGWSQKYKE
jgi:hypothetical protein